MTLAKKLKAFLRAKEQQLTEKNACWDCSPFAEDNQEWGTTETGQYGSIDINWPELDAAIDEFCATFDDDAARGKG
ncbi:MAG: hypothetical protein IT364_16505 [Candidatus Hydrogenedentes bacterium]|nr:hypothetical protein [Candidatus Hydrogenedentota bacterium]